MGGLSCRGFQSSEVNCDYKFFVCLGWGGEAVWKFIMLHAGYSQGQQCYQ